MRYKITHTTKYTYSEQVAVCHNQVRLVPRALPTQQVLEHRLLVYPSPPGINRRGDFFENSIEEFEINEPHSQLVVTGSSVVDVAARIAPSTSPPWEDVTRNIARDRSPQALRQVFFTLNSARVHRTQEFADYARPSFPAGRPMIEAVLDLTHRIYQDFSYVPGATNVTTPVEEAFANKKGVCQDFAHVGISCLRSLGVPARYVSGYLRTLPPPGKEKISGSDESHAWMAAYCGDVGWVDFDPTNDLIPQQDHVTVAWGRDYSDVCPIQGVFVGGGEHGMSVSVDVEEHAAPE